MKKQIISILLIFAITICMSSVIVFADNTSQSTEAENYGKFTNGEQIISDMIEKHGMYAHPRIIMSEEKFEKLRTHIGDDSVTALVLENLRKESDRAVKDPVQTYDIIDGLRLVEASKRIQRRVIDLAMSYHVFGDEKYAVRCYQELESASSFPDWNQHHFLDTAEMSIAFAIGYDWLYDWMNEEQRNIIKTALIEKGLSRVMDDYEGLTKTKKIKENKYSRTYCWYLDSPGCNWKLVCNGSMGLAALAIGDETEAREIAADVLNYSYKDSYNFIRTAYSEKDGTFDEGMGYWVTKQLQ